MSTATRLRMSLAKVSPAPQPFIGCDPALALGARIRSLRDAHGLTQTEVADRSGIHRPNIARVESGQHMPSIDTVIRIAAAIGVQPTAILVALDAGQECRS